jgi:hypothetical protein
MAGSPASVLMDTLSSDDLALQAQLRERGAAIARAGLDARAIAIDLDETAWDWCYPVFRQPRIAIGHVEHIYLRRPLLWLLQGVRRESTVPVRIWTAGYGVRIDLIAARSAEFAEVTGLTGTIPSETIPHVVTRLDFLRAFRAEPALVPHPEGSWIGEKVPGMPTRAGKPAIDETRVLLDDRETNCRRFVAAGPGRSALWLRGTPRIAKDNLPLFAPKVPARQHWALGIADALEQIAAGRTGLYPVDPVPGGPERQGMAILLPHRAVFRDWLGPGREVSRALRRRRAEQRS